MNFLFDSKSWKCIRVFWWWWWWWWWFFFILQPSSILYEYISFLVQLSSCALLPGLDSLAAFISCLNSSGFSRRESHLWSPLVLLYLSILKSPSVPLQSGLGLFSCLCQLPHYAGLFFHLLLGWFLCFLDPMLLVFLFVYLFPLLINWTQPSMAS